MTALVRGSDEAGTPAYRLVVPPGWTRLPAAPERLRPAVRSLLLHRFAAHPRDTTAVLRREVEQQLVDVVSGPGCEYLRMLLLLDLAVERMPVTATCLVSLLPHSVPDEASLQQLALSQSGGSVIESVVEDLGANRGVVVVRDVLSGGVEVHDPRVAAAARSLARWTADGDEGGPGTAASSEPLPDDVVQAARTTRSVDVFLPVPDASRVLLLSFSTPVGPLFEPLTTLFLTIASTVQWNRDRQSWS